MKDPLRALIVDDHPLMRTAVRVMAEQIDELEVVAEADSGEHALVLARRLRPDLVFMDLEMPEMGGLACIHSIKAIVPSALIMVLTVSDDEQAVVQAMRAGASGYLLKKASLDEVRDAVNALRAEGSYMYPSLGARTLRFLLATPEASGPAATADAATDREREVLEHLSRGLSARQIGRQLGISERTVQAHITHVYRKLGVNNRVDAVMKALQLQMIAGPAPRSASPAGSST